MRTQLLLGGRIYSPTAPDATAMAVTDGVVTWTGEDRTGRALHPGALEIDLDGCFVAPAFVDTHVHTTALGLALVGLDLSGCTSRLECIERLRVHVQSSAEPIVWGHGWDDSSWVDGGSLLTSDVDEVAPGRNVYLSRIDAHSAACSTPLRRASEVTNSTIGFHPEEPLTADAHHAVRAFARSLLNSRVRGEARSAALDFAASRGICAVHECGGPDIAGLLDFRELLAAEHGVEVRGYWGQAVEDAHSARALLAETGADGLGGDLFVDGSIGSHTAWLTESYADTAGTGIAFQDVDAIAAHLDACTEAGIQAGFHAIGDGAVGAVTDALARVASRVGGPTLASLGHRVEHMEMVTDVQAQKLAAWGVIGSMQPGFDALWGGDGGLYSYRLGSDRAKELNPFARLASAGVSLAFGSDAPVTVIDPWAMVGAAVRHRTPGSAISPRAAFSAATRGAWRAGGVRDGLAGTLVPGAPASYAVWDVDELVVRAPADGVARWSTDPRAGVPALPSLEADAARPRCVRTVHRGRVIHEA
ncbi:amidohydrolase family protein [Rhodococcus sp. G-MC3]|uniref:amidohydrolase n=1 Tax=Rhodococcus sp. G-MC3 TaxID=3046209 RepID=UPI0024BAABD7|nr:amidohydrolase family protein [Rhodococcus sp. G-MC3]MDJ0394059.1 amidohydrolase family protein [Rhodococcus sp. G-MC3]